MKNRVSDQPAFILHRRDYKESSLILEVFSEQFGRVSVLAQAARKRRDASHFQICNRLLLGWSGRGEMKTLTQIESQPLMVPGHSLPSVFYANELLLYLLAKHQPQTQLFLHYQNLLLEFSQPDHQAQSLALALRQFEMDLLEQLGLLPDLSCLSQHDQPLDAGQYYIIDPINGVCACPPGHPQPYRGADLLAIAQRRFDTVSVARAARRLMRQLIDFNLQGRTLQSRKFYQQLKS